MNRSTDDKLISDSLQCFGRDYAVRQRTQWVAEGQAVPLVEVLTFKDIFLYFVLVCLIVSALVLAWRPS